MTKTKAPCFYLPKQLMTAQYSDFSIEAKLLFSMAFTNAEHSKSIMEMSMLVNKIGDKELKSMHKFFKDHQRDT